VLLSKVHCYCSGMAVLPQITLLLCPRGTRDTNNANPASLYQLPPNIPFMTLLLCRGGTRDTNMDNPGFLYQLPGNTPLVTDNLYTASPGCVWVAYVVVRTMNLALQQKQCRRVARKFIHMLSTDVYDDMHCQLGKLQLSCSLLGKILKWVTCIGSLLAIRRELARGDRASSHGRARQLSWDWGVLCS